MTSMWLLPVDRTRETSIRSVNGDGIKDLVMHFNTQTLKTAGLLTDGRAVYITATVLDGTVLVGSDIIFLSNGPTCNSSA